MSLTRHWRLARIAAEKTTRYHKRLPGDTLTAMYAHMRRAK
jgi:hypothetical protein